jgi:hypothetical protein
MKWKTISKAEAESIMQGWNNQAPEKYDEDYIKIRNDLLNAMKSTAFDLEIDKSMIQNAGYEFDLSFGIKLFEILTQYNHMSIRTASDDGVWRYLSIHVVPDIVLLRWGMNPGRFWKEPRRIWLKTLWWYIYLSWQGDSETTRKVLENNTTDEIVQLVERSGLFGYRIELCRKIMSHYGELEADQKKRSSQIFRRVMKLNTARLKVMEPALLIGGEKEYVEGLFEYFG